MCWIDPHPKKRQHGAYVLPPSDEREDVERELSGRVDLGLLPEGELIEV